MNRHPQALQGWRHPHQQGGQQHDTDSKDDHSGVKPDLVEPGHAGRCNGDQGTQSPDTNQQAKPAATDAEEQ